MYVTDGEYNATLRKEDSIDTLTPARAQELLAVDFFLVLFFAPRFFAAFLAGPFARRSARRRRPP